MQCIVNKTGELGRTGTWDASFMRWLIIKLAGFWGFVLDLHEWWESVTVRRSFQGKVNQEVEVAGWRHELFQYAPDGWSGSFACRRHVKGEVFFFIVRGVYRNKSLVTWSLSVKNTMQSSGSEGFGVWTQKKACERGTGDGDWLLWNNVD